MMKIKKFSGIIFNNIMKQVTLLAANCEENIDHVIEEKGKEVGVDVQ